MKIILISVGKTKEENYARMIGEFEKRISVFAELEEKTVKQSFISEKATDTEIKNALEEEAKAIKKVLDEYPQSLKIAFCVEGKEYDSGEFSNLIFDPSSIRSTVVFVIGSSYGLSESVKKICDKRVSFSKMTFPHELFKLMATEQIYRAAMIKSGSKYHK